MRDGTPEVQIRPTESLCAELSCLSLVRIQLFHGHSTDCSPSGAACCTARAVWVWLAGVGARNVHAFLRRNGAKHSDPIWHTRSCVPSMLWAAGMLVLAAAMPADVHHATAQGLERTESQPSTWPKALAPDEPAAAQGHVAPPSDSDRITNQTMFKSVAGVVPESAELHVQTVGASNDEVDIPDPDPLDSSGDPGDEARHSTRG